MLLSLILVSVIFASSNQSAKTKRMVKKEVLGTYQGKEVCPDVKEADSYISDN
jgi:hypothetical protein